MTDRELVARIARSAGGKAGYKQLVRELGLGGGRERRLLLEQLARLTVRGELAKLDREHWSIPREPGGRDNLIAGRLDLHRDGYGFVRPNARQASGVVDESSFLPMRSTAPCKATRCWLNWNRRAPMAGASAGSPVCWSAAIPRWSARFTTPVANATPPNVVIPFDERMTQPILIPPGQELPPAAEDASPHRVLGRGSNHSFKT